MNTNKIIALHEVKDQALLAELVESMNNEGWTGRPVLVIPCGDMAYAMTGSHRLAAAKITETDVPVHELDEEMIEGFCSQYDVTIDDILNSDAMIEYILSSDAAANELYAQD